MSLGGRDFIEGFPIGLGLHATLVPSLPCPAFLLYPFLPSFLPSRLPSFLSAFLKAPLPVPFSKYHSYLCGEAWENNRSGIFIVGIRTGMSLGGRSFIEGLPIGLGLHAPLIPSFPRPAFLLYPFLPPFLSAFLPAFLPPFLSAFLKASLPVPFSKYHSHFHGGENHDRYGNRRACSLADCHDGIQ